MYICEKKYIYTNIYVSFMYLYGGVTKLVSISHVMYMNDSWSIAIASNGILNNNLLVCCV